MDALLNNSLPPPHPGTPSRGAPGRKEAFGPSLVIPASPGLAPLSSLSLALPARSAGEAPEGSGSLPRGSRGVGGAVCLLGPEKRACGAVCLQECPAAPRGGSALGRGIARVGSRRNAGGWALQAGGWGGGRGRPLDEAR